MKSFLKYAWLVVGGLAMLAPHSWAGVILPAAEYRAGNLGPSELPLSASYDFSSTSPVIQQVYTANAFGGAKPQADVQGSSTGSGFRPFYASAQVDFWMNVRGPENTGAPVVIHVVGHTDATGRRAHSEAQVRFGQDYSPGSLIAHAESFSYLPSYTGPEEFDFYYTNFLSVGSSWHLTLFAYGEVDTGFGGTSGFQAVSDPFIEIDPNFANRDLYSIEFSSGIGPDPVPEPGTLLLSGIALIGFLCVRHKRWRSTSSTQSGEAIPVPGGRR